jgi:hypothetical protein
MPNINDPRHAFAALALALSSPLPAVAAELTVAAPSGFVVRPATPSGSQTSAVEVAREADDAGCEVAFRKAASQIQLSQAEINALAAKPDFIQTLRHELGTKFDSAEIRTFSAGDVVGGALVGAPVGSGGSVRALLVLLDTPEGRTMVSCSAGTAQFDALLPDFEAIARGVKPPKG